MKRILLDALYGVKRFWRFLLAKPVPVMRPLNSAERERKAMEVERLDRLRNPDNYRGK